MLPDDGCSKPDTSQTKTHPVPKPLPLVIGGDIVPILGGRCQLASALTFVRQRIGDTIVLLILLLRRKICTHHKHETKLTHTKHKHTNACASSNSIAHTALGLIFVPPTPFFVGDLRQTLPCRQEARVSLSPYVCPSGGSSTNTPRFRPQA